MIIKLKLLYVIFLHAASMTYCAAVSSVELTWYEILLLQDGTPSAFGQIVPPQVNINPPTLNFQNTANTSATSQPGNAATGNAQPEDDISTTSTTSQNTPVVSSPAVTAPPAPQSGLTNFLNSLDQIANVVQSVEKTVSRVIPSSPPVARSAPPASPSASPSALPPEPSPPLQASTPDTSSSTDKTTQSDASQNEDGSVTQIESPDAPN